MQRRCGGCRPAESCSDPSSPPGHDGPTAARVLANVAPRNMAGEWRRPHRSGTPTAAASPTTTQRGRHHRRGCIVAHAFSCVPSSRPQLAGRWPVGRGHSNGDGGGRVSSASAIVVWAIRGGRRRLRPPRARAGPAPRRGGALGRGG